MICDSTSKKRHQTKNQFFFYFRWCYDFCFIFACVSLFFSINLDFSFHFGLTFVLLSAHYPCSFILPFFAFHILPLFTIDLLHLTILTWLWIIFVIMSFCFGSVQSTISVICVSEFCLASVLWTNSKYADLKCLA